MFSRYPVTAKKMLATRGTLRKPAIGSIRSFSQMHIEQSIFPNHSNKVYAPYHASLSPVKNTDIEKMFGNNNKLKKRIVPIQLRQTGDAQDGGGLMGKGSRFLIDTRLRKGPFFHLSQEAGSWVHSVYNKHYYPRAYIPAEEGALMEEYKYLTEHVTMWNVEVERQVCVKGPGADAFVDYVTTRKVSKKCPVGKCKYVILCNHKGGLLNDPVLLHVDKDEWWYSLADSDIAIYLQGVNHDQQWDCDIREIDVAPVQIQGPKAPALMADIFGPHLKEMKYYDLIHDTVNGLPVVISASGFSTELGYEIYLRDATIHAEKFWNYMLEKGKPYNMKVITPGHHRRIEAGLMSYGADIDIEVNPYECGLGWQVGEKRKDNFVGKAALAEIKKKGITHKLAGLRIPGGKPINWYNADYYHVFDKDAKTLIGYVTSAGYSPEQKANIALAMLPVEYTAFGTELEVSLPTIYSDRPTESCIVEKTPFKRPAEGKEGTGLKRTGTKL